MRHPLLLLLFWISLAPTITAQFSIKGQLQIDENWRNEIYLSIIPDLDDMYKCSGQMIIAKAPIQADGNFELRGGLFPDQEHFVRLHLSKKDDPPATLIIGGKDENHCFLSLSENSQLTLSKPEEGLFDHFRTINDKSNASLFWVDSTIQYFNTIDTGFNSLSYKNMVREEKVETLFNYADTTQDLLAALYAIYQADLGNNQSEIFKQQQRLVKRLGFHPYLPSNLQTAGTTSWPIYTFPFIAIALLGIAFFFWRKNRQPSSLQLLSQQERKVLGQLVKGKSNKEIASNMHIETTTVKSHVYKIYNKLKISSRKEVGQFKKWVDKD